MRQFNTLTGFLLSKSSNPSINDIVEFSGYDSAGDGGGAQWKHNGVTDQTPSQSPAQLGDGLLNDGNGNQWGICGLRVDIRAFGVSESNSDNLSEFIAAASHGNVFGFGVFEVLGSIPLDGVRLSGGGNLTIKRSLASVSTRVATISNKSLIYGVTFDGNQANLNKCAAAVANTFTGTIDSCTFVGSVESSGLGEGLNITSMAGATITNNTFTGNDSHGLSASSFEGCNISGNKCYSNGGVGLIANNYDQTFTQKLTTSSINNNKSYNNLGSGISVANFIVDNILNVSPRLYGPANQEATNVSVTGNHSWGNEGYGISISGEAIIVGSNIIEDNGSNGSSFFGGLLFNASGSIVTGNVITGNHAWGIDAGGATSSSIHGNVLRFNSKNTGSAQEGITIEGCVNVLVSDNFFQDNGDDVTTAQIGVRLTGSDGNGAYFPSKTSNITISNNKFFLSDSRSAVRVDDNPENINITNNNVKIDNPNNAFKVRGDDCFLDGNIIDSTGSEVALSGGSIVFADGLESILINTTTPITSIVNSSVSFLAGKVSFCTVTTGGSGYTSATVSISGDGAGATATASIYDGVIIGIIMTNRGSGYTSATVSISGDGAGATATAKIGIFKMRRGERVNVLNNQTCDYSGAGITKPPSVSLSSVPADGSFTLIGRFGNQRLLSKSF